MAIRDDELPDPFIQDEFDEIEREDEEFEDDIDMIRMDHTWRYLDEIL